MKLPTSRFRIGIDLGTSNSALCYLDQEDLTNQLHCFEIPQWIGNGEWYDQKTLPSHAFLLTKEEKLSGRFQLPWSEDSEPDLATGEWARQQQALRPERNIHSAKSWLCYHNLNPEAEILPQSDQSDLRRYSPMSASSIFLQHLRDSWNHKIAKDRTDLRLEDQKIVLTVPASFDEIAREFTLRSVKMAGLKNVTLLEEPQAAFYSWIAKNSEDYDLPKTLSDYFTNTENIVLVVDIGGGTSDFSLVKVKISDDPKENPEIERLAVSDHILLGGDNLDLAIAAHIEQQLTGQQRKLSPRLWEALTAQCRRAKEILWTTEQDQFPITIAEQGSRLIGKTKNYILSQKEFEQIILDGFFPELDWDADLPAKKIQGLRTIGLPYASDSAITRHLLRFLRNHCSQIEAERFPTHVLFNGGALEPSLLQEKIRRLLEKWVTLLRETEKSIQVLPQEQMQLAVAKGATYYHLVREGKGPQIKGGSARSYYVSLLVDEMKPGSQNLAWLCILPQQASIEEYQEVQGHTLEIAVNQPVQFEMRSSSIRTQDQLGDIIQLEQEDLERDFTELPPIQTFLGIDRNRLPKKTTALGIQLRAKLNEIGTLSLECVNHTLNEEWRLEFRIRESAPEVIQPDQSTNVSKQWEPPGNWDDVHKNLQSWFGKRSRQEKLPLSLNKQLEALLGPRTAWPLPLLREIADQLLSGMGTRVRSANHEINWLKICGFCLRPGFGFPNDELRIKQLTEWIDRGPQFRKERNVEVEWWIFCRRVAAGLPPQTQETIFKYLEARLVEGNRKPRSSKLPKRKRPASISPSTFNELWLLLSNLESVTHEKKRIYGKQLLERLEKSQNTGIEGLCLARFGSRELVHAGSLYVIPPKEVEFWIQSLLEIHHQKPIQELPLVLTKLGQFTGDRQRDISQDLRKELRTFVQSYDEDGSLVRLLTEETKRDPPDILESNLQNWLFGDELPIGLKLAKSS